MKLNKILILFCILPLLTSCKHKINTFSITYKGFDFIVKINGGAYKLCDGEGTYYPKNSLGLHINETHKDYYIEYFTLQGYMSYSYRCTNWITQGINVKFTNNDNLVYLPEGSYSLFEGDCPLH